MKSELNFEDRQFFEGNGIEDNRKDASEVYWRTPHAPEMFLMLDSSDMIELAAIGSLIIYEVNRRAVVRRSDESFGHFPPGDCDYDQ